MNSNQQTLLDNILKCIENIEFISASSLPDIDLYMDQVTTFMDDNLKSAKRYEDDKILTKNMINNYAKNHLLPSPSKKKYSKEHMLILLYIYYFKGFLSLADIQALLQPLAEHYFHSDDDINIEQIYHTAENLTAKETDYIREDIQRKFQEVCDFYSQDSSSSVDASSDSFLQIFSLITVLSYDVYIKKLLIEHLIDSLHK